MAPSRPKLSLIFNEPLIYLKRRRLQPALPDRADYGLHAKPTCSSLTVAPHRCVEGSARGPVDSHLRLPNLVFRRSRPSEFLNMSLRTAHLLLDKLRLNICRFL